MIDNLVIMETSGIAGQGDCKVRLASVCGSPYKPYADVFLFIGSTKKVRPWRSRLPSRDMQSVPLVCVVLLVFVHKGIQVADESLHGGVGVGVVNVEAQAEVDIIGQRAE